ncbi:RagB/SusD family nutrient uptake outer membrane protein [Sphingobacterium paramultivorum]|uniref:RagB/SusD family nutrient uptake outer membrane protein n=1 Tax=Sphingobacterium paramultivorum TaxID=2886510 RepID=A0A7G5E417_9SPHI|nr:P-loop NTPase fold protein [Sphingobacterium paramultivorum]QMV68742.1 RagB/SusD family nutrient uptake outer membrane protein [Sphingobacterium paramultivorum]WSO12506.1 P-loop NTPase fold protein [Sphingobacterium paramultivorum]
MTSKLIDYIISKTESKRKAPFWKYNFDSFSYLKDFKISLLKKHLIFLGLVMLFSDYLADNILCNFIKFVSNNINTGISVKIFFLAILSPALLVYCFNQLTKGFLPTINSIINSTIYSFIYLFIFRSNSSLNIVEFKIEYLYLDISFICLIIFFSQWSLYFNRVKTTKRNYQFVIDEKGAKDKFGYGTLSNELSEFIHHTDSEHSFAIGILGNWGDGKTFIANQIIQSLKDNNDDYIILEFNPWLYDKNLLIEFFQEFLNITSRIDKSLQRDFISYMSKITVESNNEKISIVNFILKIFHDDRSIESIKKNISQKIKLSRKKVIVFVDDTDRLDQEEIHHILKIIRNSADFANTFFIAGIDYNYICNQIDEPKYLEKIFNVLVTLPKVSRTVINNEIFKLFEEQFPNDNDLLSELKELLNYEWFAYFLNNLRQINRLTNSFKISYNKLQGNIDIKDLLILETLKNSATKVYIGIFNNEILRYDEMKQIAGGSREEAWSINYRKDNENEDSTLNTNLYEALQFLVKRKEYKHLRAFSNGYTLMYFNFANENIDIIDFYNVIEKDSQIVIDNFNIWAAQDPKKSTELLQLLSLHIKDNILGTYEKLIPILFRINDSLFATKIFEGCYISDIQSVDYELTRYLDYLANLLDIITENISANPILARNWTFQIINSITYLDYSNYDPIKTFLKENKDRIEHVYIRSLELNLNFESSPEEKESALLKCVINKREGQTIISYKCTDLLKIDIINIDIKSILLKLIQNYFVFEAIYTHTQKTGVELDSDQLKVFDHKISSSLNPILSLWQLSYQVLRQLTIAKNEPLNNIIYDNSILLISYIYYILTSLWGDIPLIQYPRNPRLNYAPPRESVNNILDENISLLEELIKNADINSNIYRKAISLIAKFELEKKNYDKVLQITETLINHPNFILCDINEIFDTDKESIISYNMEKFKSIETEEYIKFCKKGSFIHLIRNTEIILMASEVSFHTGDIAKAFKYLNMLRKRESKSTINIDQDNFVKILLKEWKTNLNCEGSYLIALKRNQLAAEKLGLKNYNNLLPIPQNEINVNSRMVQNPGY